MNQSCVHYRVFSVWWQETWLWFVSCMVNVKVSCCMLPQTTITSAGTAYTLMLAFLISSTFIVNSILHCTVRMEICGTRFKFIFVTLRFNDELFWFDCDTGLTLLLKKCDTSITSILNMSSSTSMVLYVCWTSLVSVSYTTRRDRPLSLKWLIGLIDWFICEKVLREKFINNPGMGFHCIWNIHFDRRQHIRYW